MTTLGDNRQEIPHLIARRTKGVSIQLVITWLFILFAKKIN